VRRVMRSRKLKPGDAEIAADRRRVGGSGEGHFCPPPAQARALFGRSPHGHSPAPADLPGSQTPTVSALRNQSKKDKSNIQIKFVYINAPFFMPPSRNRSLVITFNADIAEEPTLKQSARNLCRPPHPGGRATTASRKVNVESAPESGHFDVSYINRHLTATIGPNTTFSVSSCMS
jgi:hypothetical protein